MGGVGSSGGGCGNGAGSFGGGRADGCGCGRIPESPMKRWGWFPAGEVDFLQV